jgi:hypothetical protein
MNWLFNIVFNSFLKTLLLVKSKTPKTGMKENGTESEAQKSLSSKL